MGKYCCALECSQRFTKGGPVSFHSFPRDESRRNLWVTQMRRKDFVASNYSKLCAKHFAEDCFDREKLGGTWLKKDAVPTLFQFPPWVKSEVPKKELPEKKEVLDPQSKAEETEKELPEKIGVSRPQSMDDKPEIELPEKTNNLEQQSNVEEPTENFRRKKRCHYLGDFVESDMFFPRRAALALQQAKKTKEADQRKMRIFRTEIGRLRKRVDSLLLALKKKGSVVPKEEKTDNIPLEPTVVIKEEPTDYYSTPSTSNAPSASDEFILPHEDDPWVATSTAVEPQFTLSVASLRSPDESKATENEQAKKKLKTSNSKVPIPVPPTNGPTTSSEGSENNFGESSNLESSRIKDQFDVFGEYIAAKLRNLDRVSCAFTQKAIADIIFEAEMGKYVNQSESAKSDTA